MNWLTEKVLFGLARGIWLLLALALFAGVAAWWAGLITAGPKAEARLNGNVAEAAQQSGHDAVATAGEVARRDQEADELTRSNADDIRNAQGADAPVNPALRDAGLRSLCKREVYRGSQQCLQFAPAP